MLDLLFLDELMSYDVMKYAVMNISSDVWVEGLVCVYTTVCWH